MEWHNDCLILPASLLRGKLNDAPLKIHMLLQKP